MRDRIEQLELFSETSASNYSKNEEGRNKVFFYWISGHERFIFAVIALIIISSISFCLGIEKGKKIFPKEILKANPYADVSGDVQPPASIQKQMQVAPVKKTVVRGKTSISEGGARAKEAKKETVNKPLDKGYIIQVASYKNKSNAIKTQNLLKGKGHNVFIVSKGEFVVICIGGFSDRKSAAQSLGELKKSYRDSYVRRI